MLTADDVRDLIERHSDATGGNGRDFHNGAYVAIADELNATLGQGTCHEVMIDRFFRGCGECGYMWEYMYSIGKRVRPNFCPNCGRRIEVTDG